MITARHQGSQVAIVKDDGVIEVLDLEDAVELAQQILNECGKIDPDNG